MDSTPTEVYFFSVTTLVPKGAHERGGEIIHKEDNGSGTVNLIDITKPPTIPVHRKYLFDENLDLF